MEFSHCGKLLASGGQDHVLRVWVLKDFLAFFQQMRDKYNEGKKKDRLTLHIFPRLHIIHCSCTGSVALQNARPKVIRHHQT